MEDILMRDIELCAIREAGRTDPEKKAFVDEFLKFCFNGTTLEKLKSEDVHEVFSELSGKYDGQLFNYGGVIDWQTFRAEIAKFVEAHKTDDERDIEEYERVSKAYEKESLALYKKGLHFEADMLPRPVKPPAVLRLEKIRSEPIKENFYTFNTGWGEDDEDEPTYKRKRCI